MKKTAKPMIGKGILIGKKYHDQIKKISFETGIPMYRIVENALAKSFR